MITYTKMRYDMSIFYPDITFASAYELSAEKLTEKGIKGVIFDIDNTLVPYSVHTCPEHTEEFLKGLEDAGIAVGYVSNNHSERVELFNGGKRFFVPDAKKPSKRGAMLFAEHFGISAKELAVVGDQIFTDILFAKNAGAYSILVRPIDTSCEPWYFIFKRPIEKIILFFYRRKHK